MKKKELEDKTVAELKALAKKAGISLKANKKADIIKEIKKVSVTPKKKVSVTPKPKPVKKRPKAKEPVKKKVEKPVERVKKKVPPPKPKKVEKKPKPKAKKKPEKVKALLPKKEMPLIPLKEAKKEPLAKEAIPPKKKVSVTPKKKVSVTPEEAHLKVYHALPIKDLSPEYSEDIVIALALEPTKIFVYWEITENTLRAIKGGPCLRVYDITGVIDPSQANSSFDIDVQRIGSIYIEVLPLREFIIDAGIIGPKGFTMIVRSNKVSTAPSAPSKEGEAVLPEKYYEFAPSGWYEGGGGA